MLESVPALLTTVAPEGRDRGTGEGAGEVIVSEMSVSGGNSSSTSGGNNSPRRRRVSNDARSPRRRAFDVDFSMSPSVCLPPSTVSIQSINMYCMERRYANIATSISDLAR